MKKRQSKLDTPYVREKAIKRLASGESQLTVARWAGLGQSQVSRWLKREDIKPFLEEEHLRLLEGVPDALDNLLQTAREMKSLPRKNTKGTDVSYKASTDILKSAGLMLAAEKSQVITNIYQQKNLVILPWVKLIIKAHDESLPYINFNGECKRRKGLRKKNPEGLMKAKRNEFWGVPNA